MAIRFFLMLALAIGSAFQTGFGASPAMAALGQENLSHVVSVLPQLSEQDLQRLGGAPEGSGTVIFDGGYIATNAHVLGRASLIKVRKHDGSIYSARLIGRDPPTDLALLKIESDMEAPSIRARPPRLLEPVCALGNAFGLGLSFTCGVVSALHRTNTGFNPVEDFIQTDAAANPGSSGGGLFDKEGRLVGLVSAIFTKRSDANAGVNFATSTRLLMRVMEDLRDHGRVIRGKSGFRVGPLRPLSEASNGEEPERPGVQIVHILEGGAAQTAGLREGDEIISLDGRGIQRGSDVTAIINLFRPGDSLKIRAKRGDEEQNFELILGD